MVNQGGLQPIMISPACSHITVSNLLTNNTMHKYQLTVLNFHNFKHICAHFFTICTNNVFL